MPVILPPPVDDEHPTARKTMGDALDVASVDVLGVTRAELGDRRSPNDFPQLHRPSLA